MDIYKRFILKYSVTSLNLLNVLGYFASVGLLAYFVNSRNVLFEEAVSEQSQFNFV